MKKFALAAALVAATAPAFAGGVVEVPPTNVTIVDVQDDTRSSAGGVIVPILALLLLAAALSD